MHPDVPACTTPACTNPRSSQLNHPCPANHSLRRWSGPGPRCTSRSQHPCSATAMAPDAAHSGSSLVAHAWGGNPPVSAALHAPARSVRPTLKIQPDCCMLKRVHSLQRSDTVSWRCSTQLHGRRCCTQGWAGLRHVAAAACPLLARRVEAYALQLVRAAGCGGHIVRLPGQELALSNGWRLGVVVAATAGNDQLLRGVRTGQKLH